MLALPVYDGSDTGLKVYDTLTVIGRAIPPAVSRTMRRPACRRWPADRWHVTSAISISKCGDGKPASRRRPMRLAFELYENGVSRAILLQYTDFTMSGELTALTLKKPKPCK